MDARDDREMLQSIGAEPKRVLGDLKIENGVSIDTAWTHLREQGYDSRSCGKKTILSPLSNFAACLHWIQEMSQTDFRSTVYRQDGIPSYRGRETEVYMQSG